METLKEKFEALAHRIQSSGKPAAAWFPQFTPVTLLNAENWWEALAVCEYALDTHEDEALTAGFFELIFRPDFLRLFFSEFQIAPGFVFPDAFQN